MEAWILTVVLMWNAHQSPDIYIFPAPYHTLGECEKFAENWVVDFAERIEVPVEEIQKSSATFCTSASAAERFKKNRSII